jgi:hypothetical protein
VPAKSSIATATHADNTDAILALLKTTNDMLCPTRNRGEMTNDQAPMTNEQAPMLHEQKTRPGVFAG